MFRFSNVRLLMFFGLLLAAMEGSGLVRAQEEDTGEYGQPRRSRSLSQRLEQFRKDLMGQGDMGDEENGEPAPTAVPKNHRPKTNNRTSTTAKTNASAKTQSAAPRTAKNPSTSASQMMDRDPQSPPRGLRVAARPLAEDSPLSKQVPQPADSDAEKNGFTIPDETRKGTLSATSARPARRGGAFELPSPRMARTEQVDDLQAELEEPSNAGAEPAPTQPSDGNVLFTAKSPMLSVEATGPRKVMVGREAEFTVVLRNVGEAPASGVVVKINIPAYAEVLACEPSGGSASAPAVSEQPASLEWKFDRLEARARESLRLKLVPRKNVPLDLAMQWTCNPESTQAVVEVQEPLLSLSLSGPREVFYGQSKIYKLTISNPGNGDAENVAVNLLPIGRAGDAPANYRLGRLRAGDSKTIDIELTARQSGTLEIKAQAIGDGGLRADVTEPVVVRRAQLKVAAVGSKVKYAGTSGMFRIRVANAGDAVAEGVELSALLPHDARFLNASSGGKYSDTTTKVVWQIGTMQPGDDRTFDLHCTLAMPGANSLQAVVQAGEDLTASATTVTQVEALADLKLEVRDPQGPVAVGEEALYEIVIRNRGTRAAEGIDLTTFSSEGLEAGSVEGIEHKIAAGQVSMKTIPAIGPGGELVVRVRCKSDRGGNLVFRAELACRNPGTKLAAEETTHFYGDEALAEEVSGEAAQTEPPTKDEPAPEAEAEGTDYQTPGN